MNLAMLGKNWWHVKFNKDSLWLKLQKSKSKYGRDHNKWTSDQNGKTNSTFIANLKYLRNHNTTARLLDNSSFTWKPHTGYNVLFWEDTWVTNLPLAITFPRHYRICIHRYISIKEMLQIWDDISAPQALWSRALYAREKIEALEIYKFIQDFKHTNKNDELIWKHNKNAYTTTEMYNIINTNGIPSNYRWDFIWKLPVPPKIRTFV